VGWETNQGFVSGPGAYWHDHLLVDDVCETGFFDPGLEFRAGRGLHAHFLVRGDEFAVCFVDRGGFFEGAVGGGPGYVEVLEFYPAAGFGVSVMSGSAYDTQTQKVLYGAGGLDIR